MYIKDLLSSGQDRGPVIWNSPGHRVLHLRMILVPVLQPASQRLDALIHHPLHIGVIAGPQETKVPAMMAALDYLDLLMRSFFVLGSERRRQRGRAPRIELAVDNKEVAGPEVPSLVSTVVTFNLRTEVT